MLDTSGIISSLEQHGYDKVRKALVYMSIEKVLLDINTSIYDKVVRELKTKYHCNLDDCYEHPEYLNSILKNLYGNSYKGLAKSITKQLQEFSYQSSIARFCDEIIK